MLISTHQLIYLGNPSALLLMNKPRQPPLIAYAQPSTLGALLICFFIIELDFVHNIVPPNIGNLAWLRIIFFKLS